MNRKKLRKVARENPTSVNEVKNENDELSRNEAFKIAQEFGVKINKSDFNRKISNLSSIVSVTYHNNQICFKSHYGFIVLSNNESKSIFGSLQHKSLA